MSEGVTRVTHGTPEVQVPRGGWFQDHPDLDAVARDPAAGNVDFFRRIPKQKVASRVGPARAPHFYYRASSVQLLDGLGTSTRVHLEVVKDSQLVLNMPVPMKAFDHEA